MRRETDILAKVKAGGLSLPPAELHVLDVEPTAGLAAAADVIVEARWEGQAVRFLAEPMVVVPYLSPEKLEQLQAAGVSGVDLCGNGVLIVPGRMLVFRSGQPNRFPQSAKLRNVYRGKNSLVARGFLIQPEFAQVKDVVGLLRAREGPVAFSTVSKALKRLEEDLVVSRQSGKIRLLQADVLLDKLAANYEPPDIEERYRGRCDLPGDEITRKLTAAASGRKGKVILTGAASADKYAVTAREPVVSLYTSLSPSELLAGSSVAIKKTDRFFSLEILRTADGRVFFDPRIEDGLPYASPVQTYLELVSGDKRQKDAAEQVRRNILASLGQPGDDDRPNREKVS